METERGDAGGPGKRQEPRSAQGFRPPSSTAIGKLDFVSQVEPGGGLQIDAPDLGARSEKVCRDLDALEPRSAVEAPTTPEGIGSVELGARARGSGINGRAERVRGAVRELLAGGGSCRRWATALRRWPKLGPFVAYLETLPTQMPTPTELAAFVMLDERALRRRVLSAIGLTPIEAVVTIKFVRAAMQPTFRSCPGRFQTTLSKAADGMRSSRRICRWIAERSGSNVSRNRSFS